MRASRSKKRNLLLGAYLAGFLLAGGGAVSFFSGLNGLAVEFESRESKNISGGPVYNRVRFERRGREDIWLMQQAQNGLAPAHEEWDRIAIVVDTEKKTSRFYQLAPGPLTFGGGAKEIPYKVACYLCHANGPRALRPFLASEKRPLSVRENLAVLLMNLRISAYGALKPHAAMLAPEKKFAARSAHLNEPLKLKACASCHSGEEGGRAVLERQHFMPIGFLVKNQLMPPPGHSLTAEEKRELDQFLSGLL